MYINFWYPICLSDEINDGPKKATVLGLDFVAFRDQKKTAHCLSNVCVHRGGSLANGICHEDGTIACPYHGWRFDGSGACTKIPSLGPKSKIPKRAKVDSYPVEEKYGIVFAFLGDMPEKDRPELYEIEEYGAEGWRKNKVKIIDIDYNYERSIENVLDPAHNEFVHPTHGFSGARNDYKVNPTRITDVDFGADFAQDFIAPALDKETYGDTARKKTGMLTVFGGYRGPNTLITQIHTKKESNWFHQYFFEQPISEFKTKIFFVNMRNWLLEENMDEMIMERNMAVANEDIELLNNLRPFKTPMTMTKEVFVPADLIIGKYRNTLKEFEESGFKIDMKKLRETEIDTAYAIPSPDRRKSKNWVLDPIPLINKKKISTAKLKIANK